MTPRRLLSALVCIAAILAACAERDAARRRLESEPDKQWSGISLADATEVAFHPVRSAGGGFDSERAWSGHDDWEPAIAADPGGEYVYQLTTRYVAPKYRIAVRRSSDGGATWEADRLIYDSGEAQADPSAVVAADGTVLAVWLERWNTVLSRSEDHGLTWSAPLALNRELPWSDYPSLAVSQDGGDVYVAFNKSQSFVAASHDGGRSFSAPVRTHRDDLYWFHGGGGVAPNGDVYFGATGMRPSYRGKVAIGVLRSRDSGHTWEFLELDRSEETPACGWAAGCYQGFLAPLAAVAVDRDGTLIVTYNAGDAKLAPQRLWTRRSTDGGETWSSRRRLSRASARSHNAFSRVLSGPTAGDFRVAWQASRPNAEDAWDTWYRSSEDGGLTWSRRQRLSDRSSGAPYKTRRGYAFPYGDYLAMAVDGNGRNYVIWGEGMSHHGPGGSWYTRGQ